MTRDSARFFLALLLLWGSQVLHASENPLLKAAITSPAIVYWSSLGRAGMVKQLLDDGASANAIDEEGWSALQAAAENGHLETVKMLVGAGADVHYLFSGRTALQFAEAAKQRAVVQYLKSIGAK